jgi:4-amino-4-deoxychorismate lyase
MILVDGMPAGAVRATDRGLAYGDGVFRTLPLAEGRSRHWRRHHAKLAADCAALGLACPPESLLLDELRLACADATGEQVAKIIVTRGDGPRGYAYAQDAVPTRIVSASPRVAYPADYAERGVRVMKCRLTLGDQPALAGIKHLNRLENVLARAEWNDPSIAEGLLCDAGGRVIGGTMTNVFIATGGELATPALTRCGVAGVTRERVLDGARSAGVPCAVRDIGWGEVLSADEVILTNSLAGAWPVREIGERAFEAGPLARSIQRWLSSDDEETA